MKRKILGLFLGLSALAFGASPLAAQSRLEGLVAETKKKETVKSYHVFSVASSQTNVAVDRQIKDVTYLKLSESVLDEILSDNAALISIEVPTTKGVFTLELVRNDNLLPNGAFFTNALTNEQMPFEKGLHYRGAVKGQNKSLAAINISKDKISGIFSLDGEHGNFNLAPQSEGNPSSDYVVYNDNKILDKSSMPHCSFSEAEHSFGYSDMTATTSGPTPLASNKFAKIVLYADSILIARKGGGNATASYLSDLWNEVGTLFYNDTIYVQLVSLKGFFSDPGFDYSSSTTLLRGFSNLVGTSYRDSGWNAAQLITGYLTGSGQPSLGGLAYRSDNLLCQTPYQTSQGGQTFFVGAYSIANVKVSAGTVVNPVPNYSWNVEVVTHELGHNFGSYHTHNCSWPGGAIDNCYTIEGSCAAGPSPVGGGTIMSYCHLSSVGIDFTKGFGPLPGAKIRNNFANAACLQSLSTNNVAIAKPLVVFPNPASNELQINLRDFISKEQVLQLFDYTGKLVWEQKLTAKSAHKIDLSSMSAGVYLVKLTTTDGKLATSLFVKK